MPDLSAVIDRTAAAFAEAVESSRDRIAANIASLLERGATREEISRALAGLSGDDLLAASGLGDSVADLRTAYADEILAGMKQFAPITENTLAALVEADAARWLQFVRSETADLVAGLQQVVLSGGDARAIRAAARGIGTSRAQVEALVNTALNTFSRTVTAVQAEQAPAEALYVYAGPVDGRTRDLCLKMAAAGELTRAEIERAFPGAMRDGGGFNCRHQWLPSGSESRRRGPAAAEIIRDRGDKWKDPLTVQQQLEARDGA